MMLTYKLLLSLLCSAAHAPSCFRCLGIRKRNRVAMGFDDVFSVSPLRTTVNKTKPNDTDLSPPDILYFDIDAHVIGVADPVSILNFMILSLSYNILQKLSFLAFYLPLKQSSNVNQLQDIIDFFAKFERYTLFGMPEINRRVSMQRFDEVRTKTVNLLDIITRNDSQVPWFVLGQHHPISAALRWRMKKNSNTTKKRKLPKQRNIKVNDLEFWKINWMKYRRDALQFDGVSPKGQTFCIKAILRMIDTLIQHSTAFSNNFRLRACFDII